MEKEPRVIAEEIVDDVLDYFREELEDMRKIYPYISKTDAELVRLWAHTFLKEKATDVYEEVKKAVLHEEVKNAINKSAINYKGEGR